MWVRVFKAPFRIFQKRRNLYWRKIVAWFDGCLVCKKHFLSPVSSITTCALRIARARTRLVLRMVLHAHEEWMVLNMLDADFAKWWLMFLQLLLANWVMNHALSPLKICKLQVETHVIMSFVAISMISMRSCQRLPTFCNENSNWHVGAQCCSKVVFKAPLSRLGLRRPNLYFPCALCRQCWTHNLWHQTPESILGFKVLKDTEVPRDLNDLIGNSVVFIIIGDIHFRQQAT